MKRCKHKFKARYDEKEVDFNITNIRGMNPDAMRKLLIKKVYVKDICIICGKEVKR